MPLFSNAQHKPYEYEKEWELKIAAVTEETKKLMHSFLNDFTRVSQSSKSGTCSGDKEPLLTMKRVVNNLLEEHAETFHGKLFYSKNQRFRTIINV